MPGKAFSSDLYQRDDSAKFQVLNWLNNEDYKAVINPDQYGIDILAEKDGVVSSWEVEVKHNWKEFDFPFATIHFPGRKLKFIGTNSYFVMLNHQRNQALIVSGTDMLEAKLITKNTIYSSNEGFIEVPAYKCRFIGLGGPDDNDPS